jgi:2-polyprenyl-6-methoxyphenol hydroxylase-like FAD-dependent oxidoreductase
MDAKETPRRSAVVAGGGIGGLAAAIGLRQVGWTVTVLERAPELREVGAGWSFAPNAQRAADALGLGEGFRACSVPTQAAANLRTPSGRHLLRFRPGRDTHCWPTTAPRCTACWPGTSQPAACAPARG